MVYNFQTLSLYNIAQGTTLPGNEFSWERAHLGTRSCGNELSYGTSFLGTSCPGASWRVRVVVTSAGAGEADAEPANLALGWDALERELIVERSELIHSTGTF